MHETLEQLVARLNASAYIPSEEGDSIMAQKVKLGKGKEFDFGAAKQSTKYPWDEWFNGDLLLLERSSGDEDEKGTVTSVTEKRDFEVRRDAMPAKLKTAARRRYKVVQISKRDADGNKLANDGLIIQARDMTDDERQAEDLLRAEEKEANEARRAARKNRADSNGQPEESQAQEPEVAQS